MNEGPGILKSAYERDVPVFIPAFTDSEMGLDVATWAMKSRCERPAVTWRVWILPLFSKRFRPSIHFTIRWNMRRLIGLAEELVILTIGGGVPRNWAQQVCCSTISRTIALARSLMRLDSNTA